MAETKWPPTFFYDVINVFIVFLDPENIHKYDFTSFLSPLFLKLLRKIDFSVMAETILAAILDLCNFSIVPLLGFSGIFSMLF